RNREPRTRHLVDRRRAGLARDHAPSASTGSSHPVSRRTGPVTVFTHILATTLGVQALDLRGRDAALAYGFGVAVAVGPALKAPFYLRAVGLRDKRGYYWRSSLQEPVAFLWIVPLCLWLGTAVPLLFFAIHLLMDYSVSFEKMPLYPYSHW